MIIQGRAPHPRVHLSLTGPCKRIQQRASKQVLIPNPLPPEPKHLNSTARTLNCGSCQTASPQRKQRSTTLPHCSAGKAVHPTASVLWSTPSHRFTASQRCLRFRFLPHLPLESHPTAIAAVAPHCFTNHSLTPRTRTAELPSARPHIMQPHRPQSHQPAFPRAPPSDAHILASHAPAAKLTLRLCIANCHRTTPHMAWHGQSNNESPRDLTSHHTITRSIHTASRHSNRQGC